MADILQFKRHKPLKGFIPDDINDPICEDCRPDGRGGYMCKGGGCAGMVDRVFGSEGATVCASCVTTVNFGTANGYSCTRGKYCVKQEPI